MFNNIKILILSLILSIGLTQTVSAETIRGLVTMVHPVYSNYTQKTPYQHCYTKQVFTTHNESFNTTPTIAGGIVGGVIGNQFGKGSGKTILTVAGALLGSSIGRNLNSSGYGYTKNVQQCENRYSISTNTRIRGYNIGVTMPNGSVINAYKQAPYNPPPVHSHIDIFINYKLGNF
jgi:uncharacterized protein YcfJ